MTQDVDDYVLGMNRAAVTPYGPLESSRFLGAIGGRGGLFPSGFSKLFGIYSPCGFPIQNP